MAGKRKIQAKVQHREPKFYAYLKQGSVAPWIREEKWTQDPWVWHGRNNGFPEYLRSLVDNCGPLERAITMLAQFIAGHGVRFYGPPDENGKRGKELPNAQAKFQEWVQDASEEEFLWRCAYDLAHGLGVSFNVRRSAETIVRLDHLDRFGLRSGKLVNGKVGEYYWSSDWHRHKEMPTDERFRPIQLKAFDANKPAPISTVFKKAYRPREPYYGGLWWMGAIQAAEVWTKIDNYNRTQIDLGFSPSAFLATQFSGTETELDKHDEEVEGAYTGGIGRGIFHVTYAEGEEKPELTILPRGNHAGELDGIRTGCADVIYDIFGIPSLLMRDRSEGLTSQERAIAIRLQQMQRTLVEPLQKMITQPIQQLMALSGIEVYEVSVNPLKVFDPVQSEAIIMASQTGNEAREERGDDPVTEEWGNMPLAQISKSKSDQQMEADAAALEKQLKMPLNGKPVKQ